MVLIRWCPSDCTRIEFRPDHSLMRSTSAATISVASSQLIRSYLLLPRFCGLRSPCGSQSTRFMG